MDGLGSAAGLVGLASPATGTAAPGVPTAGLPNGPAGGPAGFSPLAAALAGLGGTVSGPQAPAVPLPFNQQAAAMGGAYQGAPQGGMASNDALAMLLAGGLI